MLKSLKIFVKKAGSVRFHSLYLADLIFFLYSQGLILCNIIQRVICFEIIIHVGKGSLSLSRIPDHSLLFSFNFNDPSLWQGIILL